MKSIAIVTTTFNRAEQTVRAFETILDPRYRLDFYICDDASTDGTPEKIRRLLPDATIVNGTGRLFWCKGMHAAMQAAAEKRHDFYLMINDDVEFFPGVIGIMLDAYEAAGRRCGITGPIKAFDSDETSYGGKRIGDTKMISPNGALQLCDLANWNCFLIDQETIDEVGLIDPAYSHSYGDHDYSLMMKRNNLPIYIAPAYVGLCDRNPMEGTFFDSKLDRKVRLKKFFSPKGMNLKSGMHFYWKNRDFYTMQGLKNYIKAYTKMLLRILLNR